MSPQKTSIRASVAAGAALLSMGLLLGGCGGEPEAEQVETSQGSAEPAPSGDGQEASGEASPSQNSSDGEYAADEDESGEDASETSAPDPSTGATRQAAVMIPVAVLEAAAVPALGNLTSITQRGEGEDAVWAMRYGLGKGPWVRSCADYGKSLASLGFEEAISERNSLYSSATYIGHKHSVSFSCEKGSMVVLVGPGW